jgi:RNA recognition motif-containing protein
MKNFFLVLKLGILTFIFCDAVRNLVLDTSEDDLRRIFSQLGAVADLWVVVDKYENQIGLAYCEFRDAQAVQIAVSHLNGVSFKGHQIQIEPTANHVWKNERSRVLQAMEDMLIHRNGRSQFTEVI